MTFLFIILHVQLLNRQFSITFINLNKLHKIQLSQDIFSFDNENEQMTIVQKAKIMAISHEKKL